MAPKDEKPEDEFSVKLDMCLTDGIVKTGTGVTLGALASLLFCRRRKWPLLAGLGAGMGLAYGNCQLGIVPVKQEVCVAADKGMVCKKRKKLHS